MESAQKVICKKCDVEMNHHADKITYPESDEDMEYFSECFQGIIEKTYACPYCKETAAVKVKEE